MKKIAILAAMLLTCVAYARPPDASAPQLSYHVVNRHPHDVTAFTEGLVYAEGKLYESTGLVGHSGVRITDYKSGRILDEQPLPPPYFGEGLAKVGSKLFQLTWTHQQAFIYAPDLTVAGSFNYRGEGWGLTFDGQDQLIESNGSAVLNRWKTTTREVMGTINVHDGDRPITMLNELEYVNGRIYANIWLTDDIVEIDAASGAVTGWINLTPLRQQFTPPQGWDPSAHVPNGIAWIPSNGHLIVTGKCWPMVFEIVLDHR